MSEILTRALLDDRFVDTDVQDGKLKYIFDKKKHAQALLHNLILMQDNDEGSLTDVIIISKEEDEFHFHGPILAALSKELEENLLKQGLGSLTSKIVIKKKFSSEAVQCLWDYAYNSVVTLTPENISKVKRLARHFGLDVLWKECGLLEQEFDERSGEDYESVVLEFQDLPEIKLDRLYDLLEQNKFCSTVFKVSDWLDSIPCHGPVIAAACGNFLLGLGFGDIDNKLEVNDETFQVIPVFLRYLYTAKLTIDHATVQPLLEMAVDFDLPSVGYACCCWLEDALTVDNALGIGQYIGTARSWLIETSGESVEVKNKEGVNLSNACNDLYQSARSFILNNFLKVIDSDEFLDVSLELLIDLINDNDLVIDSEEDVFYAIMKWVDFDPETRKVELPNLLLHIRLEHMSVEFLLNIMEHDLVKANCLCVQMVEKALKDVLDQCCTEYSMEIKGKEMVQVCKETDDFRTDFYPSKCSPSSFIPTREDQNQPDNTPADLNSRSPGSKPFGCFPLEFFDQSSDYHSSSLQEKTFSSKPDMRVRRNREAFLEKGRNVDGTPDRRLKENHSKSSVARKLIYPEEDLPRRKDGQPDRRYKVVKEFEKLQRDNIPRRKDGKPDLRFKVNRITSNKRTGQNATLKLFPQGPTRRDGQADMRFKANYFPTQGILCTGPTRKDGQPDMRFAANKQKVDIENIDSHSRACATGPKKQIDNNPTLKLIPQGPTKKDGQPDMRFKANRFPEQGILCTGPTRKDGQPDMRYSANKQEVNIKNLNFDKHTRTTGPKKQDGTPDMRFGENKVAATSGFQLGPRKKDGTPDMRFAANKLSTDRNPTTAASGPLKKDGTPDMRFSNNKCPSSPSLESGMPTFGRPPSFYNSLSRSYNSFSPPSGPLKKDGTPDMRFAANKLSTDRNPTTAASGPLKKDGTPDMRFSSNKCPSSPSLESEMPTFGGPPSFYDGLSGSYNSFACPSGPLKKDGTPDMRFSSNKCSSSARLVSGVPTDGPPSFYDRLSGSYNSFSTPSGPTKKDGTPDMRFSSNKSSSSSSFGSGFSNLGGSISSLSSGYSGGFYSSFSQCGPLKKDGTPDMRYSSNKSSFGSSSSSYCESSSSLSSGGYSGRYHSSASSGPLKKDGTPDMRYKANRK